MRFLLAVGLLSSSSIFAQGFNASVVAGYGLPWPASSIGSNSTSNADGTTSRSVVTGSLADGIRLGVEAGYSAPSGFGGDVGVFWKSSSEFSTASNSATFQSSSKIKLSQLALQPDVTLTLPGEGLRPFAKFGFAFGFPTATSTSSTTSTTGTATPTTTVSETTSELAGGMAVGPTGGIGILFPFNQHLSLVGEVDAETWSWSPTTSTRTKSTVNGVDQLPTATMSTKKTDYKDSYTTSTTTDANSPSVSLAPKLVYSSLGVKLGLRFQF